MCILLSLPSAFGRSCVDNSFSERIIIHFDVFDVYSASCSIIAHLKNMHIYGGGSRFCHITFVPYFSLEYEKLTCYDHHHSKSKIGQSMWKWIKNSDVIFTQKKSFTHFQECCFWREKIMFFWFCFVQKKSPPPTPPWILSIELYIFKPCHVNLGFMGGQGGGGAHKKIFFWES